MERSGSGWVVFDSFEEMVFSLFVEFVFGCNLLMFLEDPICAIGLFLSQIILFIVK